MEHLITLCQKLTAPDPVCRCWIPSIHLWLFVSLRSSTSLHQHLPHWSNWCHLRVIHYHRTFVIHVVHIPHVMDTSSVSLTSLTRVGSLTEPFTHFVCHPLHFVSYVNHISLHVWRSRTNLTEAHPTLLPHISLDRSSFTVVCRHVWHHIAHLTSHVTSHAWNLRHSLDYVSRINVLVGPIYSLTSCSTFAQCLTTQYLHWHTSVIHVANLTGILSRYRFNTHHSHHFASCPFTRFSHGIRLSHPYVVFDSSLTDLSNWMILQYNV